MIQDDVKSGFWVETDTRRRHRAASSVVGLEIHQNIRFQLRHPSTRGQMGEILEYHIRTRAPQSKTYNWRRGDVNTHLNIYTNILEFFILA